MLLTPTLALFPIFFASLFKFLTFILLLFFGSFFLPQMKSHPQTLRPGFQSVKASPAVRGGPPWLRGIGDRFHPVISARSFGPHGAIFGQRGIVLFRDRYVSFRWWLVAGRWMGTWDTCTFFVRSCDIATVLHSRSVFFFNFYYFPQWHIFLVHLNKLLLLLLLLSSLPKGILLCNINSKNYENAFAISKISLLYWI